MGNKATAAPDYRTSLFNDYREAKSVIAWLIKNGYIELPEGMSIKKLARKLALRSAFFRRVEAASRVNRG